VIGGGVVFEIILSMAPVGVAVPIVLLVGAVGAACLRACVRLVYLIRLIDDGKPTGSKMIRPSQGPQGKKGSIKASSVAGGLPSWMIFSKAMSEIDKGAKQNKPGYREIRKLLTNSDYDK